MASFAYTARTREGEKVSGTIRAADRRMAMNQLESQGYVPVSVKEGNGRAAPTPAAKEAKKPAAPDPARPAAKAAKAAKKSAGVKAAPRAKKTKAPASPGAKTAPGFDLSLRKGMGLRDMLLFTREMSDLLASGMTLGDALNSLSDREAKKIRNDVVGALRDDIVQGASLSEALGKHPDSFAPLYQSMVRAGEASGTLPAVLERLCVHYEKVQDAREKVLTAMVYPAVIILVGLGTVLFSMVYVIPRFTAIFEELESDLPASTQLLKSISEGLIDYWWLILLAIGAGVFFVRRAVATPGGRRIWDATKLRMPVVQHIVRANAFGQFARTLGALLNNGVPVLSALAIVENTVGNEVIREEIQEARERVTDGATISGPLAEGRVFPRLLTDMLAVGEKSGDMGGALNHIAIRYDRELDRTVKIFTTLLEPLMILVMAGLVGFVAVSMLSAVFSMTSGLGP